MGIFDYFSKKMWRHSESVDTQKEQNDLLLERLKQVECDLERMKAGVESVKEQEKGSTAKLKNRYEERQQAMLRPVHDMAQFVMENFEFRHNIVRDLYEYRRKGTEDDWKLVDNRQMNTINCRIQDDGEIFCLSSYVRQRVESDLAVDYHPVREYLNKVRGQWDGETDYIGDFANNRCYDLYLFHWIAVVKWISSGENNSTSSCISYIFAGCKVKQKFWILQNFLCLYSRSSFCISTKHVPVL